MRCFDGDGINPPTSVASAAAASSIFSECRSKIMDRSRNAPRLLRSWLWCEQRALRVQHGHPVAYPQLQEEASSNARRNTSYPTW